MTPIVDARWVGVNRWRRPTPAVLAILLLGILVPSTGTAAFEASILNSAYASCVGNDLYTYSDPEFALGIASVSGSADPELCPPGHEAYGLSLFAGSVGSASLRRGELTAYAVATGAGSLSTSPAIAIGSGEGRFLDVVTVAGPTASFGTQAHLNLHVEGQISGWGAVNATIVRQSGAVPVVTAGCAATYSGGCANNVVPEGPFAFDLAPSVSVSSSSPKFSIFVGLNASAVNEGTADASSTATFSIELPEGFTFTSESGVLLAPEPSLGALAAAALASLAACARARGTIRRRPLEA